MEALIEDQGIKIDTSLIDDLQRAERLEGHVSSWASELLVGALAEKVLEFFEDNGVSALKTACLAFLKDALLGFTCL